MLGVSVTSDSSQGAGRGLAVSESIVHTVHMSE